MKTATIQIRVSEATRSLFQLACNMNDVTMTDVLEQAINNFIDEKIGEPNKED